MTVPSSLPLVLCGPIVRRVDPTSATVFVALKADCTVTLTVFAVGPGPGFARGATVGTASRTSVRLADRLHVVAVTVAGVTLQPGTLYGYDLSFSGGASAGSLFDAEVVAADASTARKAMTYQGHPQAPGAVPAFPTFATPPADPNRLRIFHGSCRKPHGEGYDAFPALDPIIATAGGDPLLRPHQLVLGGDQIYADDVADPLIALVHGHPAVPASGSEPEVPAYLGVAARLGLAPETLPIGTSAQPTDAAYLPGKRATTIERDAKFTSGAADSHLMSLREYLCMYLMVWSDVLWPESWPAFEHVLPADTRILKDPQDRRPGETVYDLMRAGRAYTPSAQQKEIIGRYERWQRQALGLRAFRTGLAAVRRQLANVPTLMVADDHEVTDDWNMTRSWVTDAVVNAPLGRRIVRNAMAAFAVFQAWGNTPDRFAEAGAAGEPGRATLAALRGWSATPGDADDQAMRTRLGLPTGVTPEGRLVRPAGALTYHYTVTWPRYQLVALDTRTWRQFPGGAGHPGGLLLDDAPLDEMITGDGVLGDDAVTVVAQPVALFGVPILEQVAQPLARATAGRWTADAEDAWVSSDAAVHKILGRLFATAPAGPDGVRRRRLVLLGGDIHFGSAERIRYSAVLPYGCGPDRAKPYEGVNRTEGVIAGFVASALRNEDWKTRALHNVGYVPLLDVTGRIDLVGWANELPDKEGQRMQAGLQVTVAADDVTGWWVSGRPAVSDIDALRRLIRQPEWNVHVEFVRHDEADPTVRRDGTPESVVDPAGLPRDQALAQYLAAARNLDRYKGSWESGKEIVGYNNLGEITFDWPAGECKSATQRLWWHLPGEERAAALSTFTVDLSYGCSLTETAPYGGWLLRPDDRDATATAKARYDGVDLPAALVTERWVSRLQHDLATLGFLTPGEIDGVYGIVTYWAVREFQTYARIARTAVEAAGSTAPRWSDRLQPVDVPEAERYLGPVSGVADLATQVAMKRWLQKRWRCPVVVESWQVAGDSPQRLAAPNVWIFDEVTAADQRLYSRVVTGRPPGAGSAPEGHPELIRLGSHRPHVTAPEWSGPVLAAESELLPEAILPRPQGHTAGPTLGDLAAAIAAGGDPGVRAARQLSTFKVLRAVAENRVPDAAGGWLDSVEACDPAVIRFGPFGWRAHGPLVAPTTLPPALDIAADPGELWAYLAFLRATDRDAYDALGGQGGVTAVPGWGRDGAGLLFTDLRVLRARAAQADPTGAAREGIGTTLELLGLRSWHWMHRYALALRGHDGVRRGLWTFARQRLHDLLATDWDSPDPAVTPTVADVPAADGTPRRARIGDLFTSERSVAVLACWQQYRAHHLVALGPPASAAEKPEFRTRPRAATELHQVLVRAKTLGPDFAGAPTGWTDAHETALVTAVRQVVAADGEVAAALASVIGWPSWPTGRRYTLPVPALPAAEQGLSAARGSLRLDLADLPRVTA
ncbi:peptidoglycan hydrolase-like protein with peptidoglycan-binding domain [Micromonospora sp. A200]|uniref:peptidoglycan-binding domain-containing protein n=1 Tax=Micromonospora sp. A200 TaxID=2940568 RepID=UPI002473683A|nr:peptidoglycan-binding domain-containing protein [Micromonospora sp. A200]MDH6466241.1 peptidoglycan hydrolase-like protein with peptidoglycan-binding domain [Micromonospora sp. A200]